MNDHDSPVDPVVLDPDDIDDLVDLLHDAAHALTHHPRATSPCCPDQRRTPDDLWWDLTLTAQNLTPNTTAR